MGEGQGGRGVDLVFKYAFMNTKRRAVSSTHAKAQIAARPASSRLGRPDTEQHLAIEENQQSQIYGEQLREKPVLEMSSYISLPAFEFKVSMN